MPTAPKDSKEHEDAKETELMKSLSEEEIRTLLTLSEKEHLSKERLSKDTSLDNDKLGRVLLHLENKKLISEKKEEQRRYVLTKQGEKYLDTKLPEEIVYDSLASGGKPLDALTTIEGITVQEARAAIGILKSLGLAAIKQVQGSKPVMHAEKNAKILEKRREEIKEIASGKSGFEALKNELAKRGIMTVEISSEISAVLTDFGASIKEKLQKSNISSGAINALTPEMIKNRSWEKLQFRRYDIHYPVPEISGGREHPLKWLENTCRQIFVGMGFKEMRGDWVETSFWNMDAMFIPQNHPSRTVQDTFYIGESARIKPDKIVNAVKSVQETGAGTGSTGYKMPWSIDEAAKLVLRSHTTDITYRLFASGIKPPAKYFSVGRVFRNETLDRMHLAEFHQIEGFVTADGLNMRNLEWYLKEFYSFFNIKKLKFMPTYNPYTEPSIEVYAYHSRLEKWLEIGNSGIFRPEAQHPYALKTTTVAWGLALERLASLLFDVSDIRQLVGHEVDLGFIRNYKYSEIKF